MLRTISIDGRPGDTAKYTSGDVAASLPAAVLTDSGADAVGLLISVETYAVRITFGDGVDPTTALGHYLGPGYILRVYGNDLVSTFQYINASAGQNAVLQITPFYE